MGRAILFFANPFPSSLSTTEATKYSLCHQGLLLVRFRGVNLSALFALFFFCMHDWLAPSSAFCFCQQGLQAKAIEKFPKHQAVKSLPVLQNKHLVMWSLVAAATGMFMGAGMGGIKGNEDLRDIYDRRTGGSLTEQQVRAATKLKIERARQHSNPLLDFLFPPYRSRPAFVSMDTYCCRLIRFFVFLGVGRQALMIGDEAPRSVVLARMPICACLM